MEITKGMLAGPPAGPTFRGSCSLYIRPGLEECCPGKQKGPGSSKGLWQEEIGALPWPELNCQTCKLPVEWVLKVPWNEEHQVSGGHVGTVTSTPFLNRGISSTLSSKQEAGYKVPLSLRGCAERAVKRPSPRSACQVKKLAGTQLPVPPVSADSEEISSSGQALH